MFPDKAGGKWDVPKTVKFIYEIKNAPKIDQLTLSYSE